MNEHVETNKKIEIPSGEYAEYLAHLAGNIADDRAKKRELVYRGLTGLVIAILALLGYSNLSSLRQDVKTLVFADVKPAIAHEVNSYFETNREKLTGDRFKILEKKIEEQVSLLEFVRLAVELDNRTESFTHDERDAAIAFLKKLSKSSEVKVSKQFILGVEKVVRAFAQADLNEQIDEIVSEVKDLIPASLTLCEILVMHYGMRAVGDHPIDPKVEQTFDEICKQADRHRFSARALAYRILRDYRKSPGKKNPVIESYFQDVKHFDAAQKGVLLRTVMQFQLMRDPHTGQLERLKQIADGFCRDYKGRIDQLQLEAAQGPPSP